MSYTSLAVSKLIHEKVPEVETAHWWNDDGLVYLRFDRSMVGIEEQLLFKKSSFGNSEFYPAYTLADVIKAIKVLGEKKEDWIKRDEMTAKTTRMAGGNMSEKQRVYHMKCEDFISAYLPSLSLQDPQVEKFLTNLFNN